MWVLIVMRIAFSNGDFVAMQEFSSQQSCIRAGEAVKRLKSTSRDNAVTWECVRR
jgi:hypothetical protein